MLLGLGFLAAVLLMAASAVKAGDDAWGSRPNNSRLPPEISS
jgi:hypothetical protein